jgi:hypothetical protein
VRCPCQPMTLSIRKMNSHGLSMAMSDETRLAVWGSISFGGKRLERKEMELCRPQVAVCLTVKDIISVVLPSIFIQ